MVQVRRVREVARCVSSFTHTHTLTVWGEGWVFLWGGVWGFQSGTVWVSVWGLPWAAEWVCGWVRRLGSCRDT